MMERFFYSAFLTACFWGIANLQVLPQTFAIQGQVSSTGDWFHSIVSEQFQSSDRYSEIADFQKGIPHYQNAEQFQTPLSSRQQCEEFLQKPMG